MNARIGRFSVALGVSFALCLAGGGLALAADEGSESAADPTPTVAEVAPQADLQPSPGGESAAGESAASESAPAPKTPASTVAVRPPEPFNPKITITPTKGYVGDRVTFALTGFAPNKNFNYRITWSGGTSDYNELTDATGSWSITDVINAFHAVGVYTYLATQVVCEGPESQCLLTAGATFEILSGTRPPVEPTKPPAVEPTEPPATEPTEPSPTEPDPVVTTVVKKKATLAETGSGLAPLTLIGLLALGLGTALRVRKA